jgi:hypothetical protein
MGIGAKQEVPTTEPLIGRPLLNAANVSNYGGTLH